MKKKSAFNRRGMGSDMMLNKDSLRYDYEMHLCRIRIINPGKNWGGE